MSSSPSCSKSVWKPRHGPFGIGYPLLAAGLYGKIYILKLLKLKSGFYTYSCSAGSGPRFASYHQFTWLARSSRFFQVLFFGSAPWSFRLLRFFAIWPIKCEFFLSLKINRSAIALFRYRYQTADQEPDSFKNERIRDEDRMTFRHFFKETKTKYVRMANHLSTSTSSSSFQTDQWFSKAGFTFETE